ncbi:YwqH-like family protein [Virgibacillus dakarensis]|uniref:YwqH-like family protein n=1 Tax=Virgibacillus dakarensis TaxID=1917889 RepID=UPI002E11656C
MKIIADQDELSMQKGAVNQPDLSSETWQGKHTNDFLDKRENIKQEYNNMMNTQVGILLDNIANAIERLKKANLDLSSSIETNRYRIRQLREMEDD